MLGGTEPHFPLYLAEAVVVELAALAIARSGPRHRDARPVVFGAVCGVADRHRRDRRRVGLDPRLVRPPVDGEHVPRGRAARARDGRRGRHVGGFVGRALTLRGTRLAPAPYWALPGCRGRGDRRRLSSRIPISAGDGSTRATLHADGPARRRRRAQGRGGRAARPARRRRRRALVDHDLVAGQGGQRRPAHGARPAPGEYRTTEPVPVDGTWKTILRLHRDDEVLGLPVFLPEDPAIPAKEVPATATIDRAFVLDKKNLQREQKKGVSGVLTTAAYIGVLVLVIPVFAILFWVLRRIRMRLGREEDPPARPPFAEPLATP